MTGVRTSTVPPSDLQLNVADRLAEIAAMMPDSHAVVCPPRASSGYRLHRRRESGSAYETITFAELDADATRLARGLIAWGVPPGTRLAMLVRPGIEFVTFVFALLRAGMVIVLIDPGLGRRNLVRCLEKAEPHGFVAIGLVQAARLLLRSKFPHARWNVTVGRRWFWGGLTLDQLRSKGNSLSAPSASLPATCADDPAAIIFTSGSTGPPKGVLYTHRMFDTQVSEIQAMYRIERGGVDLACFPLFALFNSAMGVTTVLPEMDFSRPASANPQKLVAAANDWQATQAFASPAVWRVVADYCAKKGERIPTLRQAFSCGAPVPADVLRQTLACVSTDAQMHTPYGATECLPIATIEAAEVLADTAHRTNEGAGVCVGRKFDSIDWQVIRITDQPIASIDEAEVLPPGQIGELIVRGPQVSPRYVTRIECNADAKIGDQRAGSFSPPTWHRTGDVGYLDDQYRFWYCGRKSHRVESAEGPLFTECVEAIFNTHSAVLRSALVGVGDCDREVPVLIIEPKTEHSHCNWQRELSALAQAHDLSDRIQHFLMHPHLPVDVRHNAKINREQLAAWAAKQLSRRSSQSPAPSP